MLHNKERKASSGVNQPSKLYTTFEPNFGVVEAKLHQISKFELISFR